MQRRFGDDDAAATATVAVAAFATIEASGESEFQLLNRSTTSASDLARLRVHGSMRRQTVSLSRSSLLLYSAILLPLFPHHLQRPTAVR